ncbi:hypothetical protein [Xanthomonas sp. NCPPB 2632]|uniref:hypothetical protein n=1 Tax=Xanthomonas sp. NCPPB 2632 TaxID=3240912 RepID=UPI0035194FF8
MAVTVKRPLGTTAIEAFEGTPREVSARLAKAHGNTAIGFAMPFTLPHAAAVRDTLANLLPFIGDLVEARSREAQRVLIEALVPTAFSRPDHKIKLMKMEAEVRKTLLESGDFMTAADIADLAGLSTKNPGAQPNKWKAAGRIFAITRNNLDHFPIYALDRARDYRPLEVMGRILDVFAGRKDPWRLAAWFASANSFLGGHLPKDVLESAPDSVVDAAKDEVEGPIHA